MAFAAPGTVNVISRTSAPPAAQASAIRIASSAAGARTTAINPESHIRLRTSTFNMNYPLFLHPACTILLGMQPVAPNQQRSLVERLTKMCGGAYGPETRRKYFISGPQWAAAYQGQALFYAPTRHPKTLEENGVKCSMVTTETFYHAVFAAGPAPEAPEVREYAAFRVRNTVDIGHELGARY